MLSVFICSKVITLSGNYCTKQFLVTFWQLPKDNTKQSISTRKRLIETWQKNDWFSWTKYIIFQKKEIVLKQKKYSSYLNDWRIGKNSFFLLVSLVAALTTNWSFFLQPKKIVFEVSKKALNVSNKRGS